MPKRTPLYGWHVANGGKMVDYADFYMPVQFAAGIIKEHTAVRTKAGLFDVSHMGEFTLNGPGALAALQRLVTNDCAKMYDGQVKYSPMCNENGGTVDDLLIYRKAEDEYMIVVNASNKDKDFAHMSANLAEGAVLADNSDETAMIAIQGPNSLQILANVCDTAVLPVKYYSFREAVSVAGVSSLVSRTGYTGEDGYELYIAPESAQKLWEALIEAGAPHGLIPCGLGARDTLRMEAAMPLFGHELDDDVSPIEAGLAFFVNMDKGDFIGRDAMRKAPASRVRVGILPSGKGIARSGAKVFIGGKEAGVVTSGTHSITLGRPIAMVRLNEPPAPGLPVTVDIRGRIVDAELTPLPFYKRAR